MIEEFKSTRFSAEGFRLSGRALERDRQQLLGYCYLWRRLGHLRVSGALVYVDIATGEEISLAVGYDDARFDSEIEGRLLRLLRIWQAQSVARARKAEAARRLPF